jgi:DNA-binding NarL/FixJ family response regulator
MTGHTSAANTGANQRPLPRLLIADDDPIVLSVISAQLTGSFDIVAEARDAEEAISRAVEQQPDVAIIDIQMPAGGGIRAIRELHERTPATAVVALSSDESDEMVRAVIMAGAATYVRKGVPGHELAHTVVRAIETHAQISGTVRIGTAESDGPKNLLRTHG